MTLLIKSTHQRALFLASSLALSTFALVACGGGGGGSDSTPSNTSTPPPTTATQNPTPTPTPNPAPTPTQPQGAELTVAQIKTCPAGTLNPADITKLGCLVGKFSGQVFNHTTGQLTNQACEVQLSASGRLSMTIGGQSVYDQPLSTQAAILDVDQDPTNVSSLYVKEQTGEISLGNLNSDTQGFFIGVIPPASNETLWKLIGIKATQTGPTDNDIDYQTCVATK